MKKHLIVSRKLLTKEAFGKLNSVELLRFKLNRENDSTPPAKSRARLRRIEFSARLRLEEEPMLADLREVGWDVESVWGLAHSSRRYPEAIPILLTHLLRPYSDLVRDGIARALAVPEPGVRNAWSTLAEQYRTAPMGSGIAAPGETEKRKLSAKYGLACTLAVAATAETLEELISLAKDRSHGNSRLLLLPALRRRHNKNPRATQAVQQLTSDPVLKKEIVSWFK